jgi:hypothetical protein
MLGFLVRVMSFMLMILRTLTGFADATRWYKMYKVACLVVQPCT